VTLPGLDFSSAERLKYLHGVKKEIKAELSDPSDWFVREMAVRVHSAQRITGQLQEKFKPIVIDAIKAYINDRINEGPSTAMEVEKSAAEAPVVEQTAEEESGGTVYTDEKRRPLHCEGNLRCRNRPHEANGKRHESILRHYLRRQQEEILYSDALPAVVHLESISALYKHVDRIRNALRLKLA